MSEIHPHKTLYPSKALDGSSIALVRRLLPREIVNSDKQEEGGSQADIDGYLDICDTDGYARAKITVQVKHITLKKGQKDVYYDIPSELYGYAGIHKGEVVVFIACDTENDRFFWKAISLGDVMSIKEGAEKPQKTYRYHFSADEICSASTARKTISAWHELFEKRMDSIKDDRYKADKFAQEQRLSFNTVSTELHGIVDSHIYRHQVNDILKWINGMMNRNGKSICLLVGNAGVGKSAVLKEVINAINPGTSKCLCIKADAINDSSNKVTLSDLHDTIEYYHGTTQSLVLIIDQIDALSQSMSNDRNHLNMMMSLLSSLNKWPNVCAVVSCRRYDLDYDSDLCQLKEKAEIIEIGELTDSEVYSSLDKIDTGLKDKIDSTTISTLKTVQHLDTFCLLYGRNRIELNFSSPTELYDALWDEYVDNAPSSLLSADIEHELFQITEVIRKSESLSPVLVPSTVHKKRFDYLASCGLIKRFNNTVSFFHQSFYEYTLARYYVSRQGKFISDIEADFQGIETRSLIKAVLEYERGHNEEIFNNEVRSIIESGEIRLHIKLLAISILASETVPTQAAQRIIKEVCTKDERFLLYFLRGVQEDGWFHTVRNLVKSLLPGLNRESHALTPIVNCLSRFVFKHPDETYRLVNTINDNTAKVFAISYLIRGHNNYKSECVQKAFISTRDRNYPLISNLINDAFNSNVGFASSEAEYVLTGYLMSDHKTDGHERYGLVDVLLPSILNSRPKELLMILHKSFVCVIEKSAYNDYQGFTATSCFNASPEEKAVDKILDMYEMLLGQFSDCTNLLLPIIEELIALKNKTSVAMAFAAMSANPQLYDGIIRPIAYSPTETDRYLHDDYIAYFFVKMLKSWYFTLTEEDRVSYQKLLLVHTSSYDFIAEEKRYVSLLLYPFLWRDKWILICNTLPEKDMIPAMRRCAHELRRRFGKKIVLERQNHMLAMAGYCGGIVDSLTYSKFSLSNWMNSFLKLKDERFISLEAHADAFQKCVSEAPDKFKQFIFDISKRQDINTIYKTAGLKGLLAGKEKPARLWSLCMPYISAGYASEDSYSFYQIADYYTKEENGHIDDIINIATEIATLAFSEKRYESTPSESDDKREDISCQANDLLNTAINSPQGRALELLIHICALPERKAQIYAIFSDIQSMLPRCLKALLLNFLYTIGPFDDKLYFDLMKQLLEEFGPEALIIRGDAIQGCFYHKRDIVADYIGRIESDPSSHEILAQIYFYGTGGESGQDEYKRLLDKILSYNSEDVISKIIEVAFESYSDCRYTEYSKDILTRFSTDERESIVSAYSSYCHLLPVDGLEFFCSISKADYGKTAGCIYGQLEYIQKCISTFPERCYEFISAQQYYKRDRNFSVDEDIVHILLEIYKKMKEDDDLEVMNGIMDMFDEFIYQDNYTLMDAIGKL